MTKKQARKEALRWIAALVVGHDLENEVASRDEKDGKRFREAVKRIADHLEWEADGRPERT